MFTFGAWAGVLFGGTFGIAGALLLSLMRGSMTGWSHLTYPASIVNSSLGMQTICINLVIQTLLGAFSGIGSGLIIGPLVGIITSVYAGKWRRMALPVAIATSTLAGLIAGFLGFVFLNLSAVDGPNWIYGRVALVHAVAAFIGGLCGFAGGRQLGTCILAFHQKAEDSSDNPAATVS